MSENLCEVGKNTTSCSGVIIPDFYPVTVSQLTVRTPAEVMLMQTSSDNYAARIVQQQANEFQLVSILMLLAFLSGVASSYLVCRLFIRSDKFHNRIKEVYENPTKEVKNGI